MSGEGKFRCGKAERGANLSPGTPRCSRYSGAESSAGSSKELIVAESKIPIPENASTNGGATAESGGLRWQAAGRALRHRNFQLFFSGQLISLIGTWMQTVAQSWLVYRLTGSGLQLGAVGFASQIPVFLCRAHWRDCRRSQQPQACGHRDADRVHAAGVCAGGAYADRTECKCGTYSCWRRCWAW